MSLDVRPSVCSASRGGGRTGLSAVVPSSDREFEPPEDRRRRPFKDLLRRSESQGTLARLAQGLANAPNCLARAVLIFNQGEAYVIISCGTEAYTGRHCAPGLP